MNKLLLLIILVASLTGFSQPGTYTIVFLNSNPDAEKVDKETQQRLFEAHMANIDRLAKEGKLLAAGPFEGGGGLFIFNTTSLTEAESWVNTDPAVQAKRWNIEILPYTPRLGSICPVTENYEMVTYTLVRFNAVVDKFTASSYPMIIRQHETYVQSLLDTSQVITEAIFGPNEGGVLIVKGDLSKEAFAQDPGVQQGLIDVQIKKLYIARTSFCEK